MLHPLQEHKELEISEVDVKVLLLQKFSWIHAAHINLLTAGISAVTNREEAKFQEHTRAHSNQ